MKHLMLVLAALAGVFCANAQTQCDSTRYFTANYFSAVDVTSDVVFGSNTAVLGGGQQTLKLDVYEPSGDNVTDRPVIFWFFGGSFVGGSRTDGYIQDLCTDFAKMGYVCVAADYRVGAFIPDEDNTTMAVVRAVHDARAAIRYMRKTFYDMGNPYGIDPDKIIVGGVSAGAITAVQVAYLDKLSEIPAYFLDDTTGMGGLEGYSGNPGYSSDVIGVVSFSGTLKDTTWMEAGDQPIISIHETGDNIVPFGTQEIIFNGVFPTGLVASGSRDIHVRANNLGVPNQLRVINANNHTGYIGSDFQGSVEFVRPFVYDMICKYDASAVRDIDVQSLDVYPNPSDHGFYVNGPAVDGDMYDVNIYNAIGENIRFMRYPGGQLYFENSELNPGWYIVEIANENNIYREKVIVQ